MHDADVVVVGGGLGGLAAAISARDSRRSVLVLESDVGPSEVDTGITLWGFAIRTLRLLGIDDATRIGAPLERLVSYSASGRLLSEVDLGGSSRDIGAASFDVHRAALQLALTDALGREHVRYNARCLSIREHAHGVVAELADGSEISGRVLVGADGVHSVARSYVAPDARIHAAELGVWRGILELNESAAPPGVHLRIYGPRGLFGAARLDDRRVRWYAGARVSPETEGTWQELASHFGGWCEPVATVIEASRDRALLYHGTPRFGPLPRWVRGRIALVGDAAHATVPTLGVSGGLALADGLFLGTALARGLDPSALASYERRRRPIGRRVQREAEAFRLVLTPRRRRLVRVRDRFLRPPFDWAQERGIAHLSRGAETSVATDLLPRRLHPANRVVLAGEAKPVGILGDPASDRCLAALRRASGVDRGPMELHSRRVLRIALHLAAEGGHNVDEIVLRCATVLHDIGLYEPWWDGGPYVSASAHAARAILEPLGWEPLRLQVCLAAIRRHHAATDQSEAGQEVELLRRADLVDVSAGRVSFGIAHRWLAELFRELPRDGFERHLSWLLVRRAVESPGSVRALFLETVRQSL